MYDIEATAFSDRFSKDSAFVSVVAKLKKDDIIGVRIANTATKISIDGDKTFFGFYLLRKMEFKMTD